MKWIRGHKYFVTQAVCAILISALFLGYLSPCHEYIDSSGGSVILGYDTCDDSPCLSITDGNKNLGLLEFINVPKTRVLILRIFPHSIFHPPKGLSHS
jgi:hypothetical protein